MKKLFTLTCLLFSFFTQSSHLITVLRKVLNSGNWLNETYVEIPDLTVLNPGIKLATPVDK